MKHADIIQKLNLEQKCALLSGETVFTTRVRTALRGGLLDDLRQASADISRSLYGYQPADDLL